MDNNDLRPTLPLAPGQPVTDNRWETAERSVARYHDAQQLGPENVGTFNKIGASILDDDATVRNDQILARFRARRESLKHADENDQTGNDMESDLGHTAKHDRIENYVPAEEIEAARKAVQESYEQRPPTA